MASGRASGHKNPASKNPEECQISDRSDRPDPLERLDEVGTLEWLNKVWNRRPGALLKKPLLLVWDMFRAHHTEPVRKRAEELKTMLTVIPGGLKSVLQPLDVCLNKLLKDRVRKMWSEWKCDVKLMKGGNVMKPDMDLLPNE